MKKYPQDALEVCLDKTISAEEQLNILQNMGYDLEDIFEIAMQASELEE